MFDNPIFFLILISVISAISDWLGKRRKAKRMAEELEGTGELESMPQEEMSVEIEEPRQSVREQKQEWEERLRRLLEGDDSPVQADPQPAAPVYSEPRSSNDEGVEATTGGYFFSEERDSKATSSGGVGAKAQALQREQLAASERLREAKSMGSNTKRLVSAMKVTRLGRRNSRIETNFHSKSSIRQAIVASVVLGAPKGSGEQSDLLKL